MMVIGKNVSLLQDLSPHQIAFCLIGVHPSLTCFSVLQLGGELLLLQSRLTAQAWQCQHVSKQLPDSIPLIVWLHVRFCIVQCVCEWLCLCTWLSASVGFCLCV